MPFYSSSTRGFYLSEIHGDNIPADAVEITEAEHRALLDAQTAGNRIQPDARGRPVALPPPPKTPEQIAADEADAARRELAELDMQSIRDIRAYIAAQPGAPQRLRDLEATAVATRSRLSRGAA